MNRKAAGLYILLFLLLLPATGRADELKTILQGLSLKYSRVKTLSAEFFQETEHRTIKKKTLASGKVLFKRPDMFRWLILNPTGEEIISDGKTLWIYQPDLAQVVKTTARSGIPALVVRLMGSLHDVERLFTVRYIGKVDNTLALELRPREEMDAVDRLVLFVDSKEFSVVKIEIHEGFGRTVSIRFHNVVLNPVLDESVFKFRPRSGVTIVEP